MQKSNSKNKALYIFLSIFAVVGLGIGGYIVWDIEQTKKINATIVTEDEADAIAQQVLK